MYPLAFISIFLLTLRSIYKSKKAIISIKGLIGDKRWLVNFYMIVVFSIYIIYSRHYDDSEESQKVKMALKKAMLAFLIAVLTEMGLTIAPFWLVFVLAYYLDGWI